MGVQRWDGRIDHLWSFIASAPAGVAAPSGQRPPSPAEAKTVGFTLSSVAEHSQEDPGTVTQAYYPSPTRKE